MLQRVQSPRSLVAVARRLSAGAALAVVLLGMGAYHAVGQEETEAPADGAATQPTYTPATVAEIAADPVAFDGRHVIVGGRYRLRDSLAGSYCGFESPPATSPPVLVGTYVMYGSRWSLIEADTGLSVVVVLQYENGVTQDSTAPHYVEDEHVELRGVVRAAVVAAGCDPNVLYQSAYLEVQRWDADMPPTTPLL